MKRRARLLLAAPVLALALFAAGCPTPTQYCERTTRGGSVCYSLVGGNGGTSW